LRRRKRTVYPTGWLPFGVTEPRTWDHHGLSTGQRSVSRSGGYGVIFSQLYGAVRERIMIQKSETGKGVKTCYGFKGI
jgi:hypothetical protein